MSDLFKSFPELVSTPEMRLPCPDEHKFEVVRHLQDDLRTRYKVIDVDGARIVFEHGWGLIRASNTHGMLTVRAEAESAEYLDQILQIIRSELEKFPAVNLSSFSSVPK